MRYVLRREFFGGLAYDTVSKDYLHLDHLAMLLLTCPQHSFTSEEFDKYETDYDEIAALRRELSERQLLGNVSVRPNVPAHDMLSAPMRVFYEITYRCTESCKHCYTDSHEKHPLELALEEKFSVVDQLCDMGCYRISIAGGEPLIEKDFFPFVEYALDKHIDISFSTNGTPVTERVARRLDDLDIRTINVSLDGWDDESFGAVRGEGRLQYVVRGIRTLRKYYTKKIAAKVTLMSTNVRNLDKIMDLALELGFDDVKFNCVREAGRAIQNEALLLTQDEYLDTIQRLAHTYNSRSNKIKMTLPVNPYQELTASSAQSIDELGFGCYAGKESFCITPIGEIQPCSSFGPGLYSDGNVRTTSLKHAWESGVSMNLFRYMDGGQECSSCSSYSGCRGGCYLRSYQASGNIRSVDPYCYERKNSPVPSRGLGPLVQITASI
jgi:radical SAM protein with 4Fe4S-binding SPASM domain